MLGGTHVGPLVIALALASCLVGCATSRYVHCVYFSCKDDTTDAEIDAMVADGEKLLGRIPTVRDVACGRRDPDARRDINVQDYDVGLVVTFDDRAGQDVYQDHELHKQFIANHKAHWARVRVYDFQTAGD
jgi:hypothetical protein